MPVFALYIVKVFISLSSMYIFYRLLLQGLTFYNLIRWYLIVYSFLSFFIPFINISTVENRWSDFTVQHIISPVGDSAGNNAAVVSTIRNSTWDTWDYLLMILVVGTVVMLVRISLQWLSFLAIR